MEIHDGYPNHYFKHFKGCFVKFRPNKPHKCIGIPERKSPDMNPKPTSPVSGGDPSGSGLPPPSPGTEAEAEAVVIDLVTALGRRRLYREVTLALRSGLRDARADFSFLRTRGLRCLIKFLHSVAGSDESVRLFRHSQTVPELQGLCFYLSVNMRLCFHICSEAI